MFKLTSDRIYVIVMYINVRLQPVQVDSLYGGVAGKLIGCKHRVLGCNRVGAVKPYFPWVVVAVFVVVEGALPVALYARRLLHTIKPKPIRPRTNTTPTLQHTVGVVIV